MHLNRLSYLLRGKIPNSQARLVKPKTVLCNLFGESSRENSSVEEDVLFETCLPGSLTAALLFLKYMLEGWDGIVRNGFGFGDGLLMLGSVLVEPVLLTIANALFAIVFRGSMSKYPRKLFGLEGTLFELATGSYVVLNFAYAFIGYAFHERFSSNTFKPSWTEYLG